jgi:hypothetical protein
MGSSVVQSPPDYYGGNAGKNAGGGGKKQGRQIRGRTLKNSVKLGTVQE